MKYRKLRITSLAICCCWILITVTCYASPPDSTTTRAPRGVEPSDSRFAPYDSNPNHLWNRLHQALFVREAGAGGRQIHTTDPFLSPGRAFLLEGESHRRALAVLDEFLAKANDVSAENPRKRLLLQHDLWAAFDYAAWYPDEWVYKSRYEPAAIALRKRLAKAIGRLALDDHEIDALPDNYALAVKSKQFAAEHDSQHPERPFLPKDLFDPAGPWVRFLDTTQKPMAERHFASAGGRAVHIIFLRLPGGRAPTEAYLKQLNRMAMEAAPERLPIGAQREPDAIIAGFEALQFPPGTMVAMVRRALTVDRSAKIRVTPVTELVQIRVYRRIPADLRAAHHGDFGEQDVYEFVLDRTKLFAGEHGLRAVGPNDPAEPFLRLVNDDLFEIPEKMNELRRSFPQLKSCIQCHQAPGLYSVLSMQRGLRQQFSPDFRTYEWDVELKFTVQAKAKQYNWGLLQGNLEEK